tara:strand:- start:6886 stop:7011 length:126 start_codon:yes stop_codon:yes gene_type:complete
MAKKKEKVTANTKEKKVQASKLSEFDKNIKKALNYDPNKKD